MSDEYLFEATLTMMGEEKDISFQATINPLLSSVSPSPSISTNSLSQPPEDEEGIDLGVTIPAMRSLPLLELHGERDSFSGFEIRGTIGAGGMGVVELAWQQALRREVAIKRPNGEAVSETKMRALLKEGVLTGQLEHPNIVPVHFLGRTENGNPVLVMKRISGTSWRELIYNPTHPMWEQVKGERIDWHLRVMLQVSNAVDFAHSQRILHRDIKAENVMLGGFGEVYLLDWGIGLKLEESGDVAPKQFAGTPSCMAPEMLGGRLTARTDIYLLGATLHEVLTQSMIHDGNDFAEVVSNAKCSAPYTYSEDIPEELAAICHRATHRDPAQRFPSVAAFRAAIEEHLSHRNAIALVESAKVRLDKLQMQVDAGLEGMAVSERIVLHELATECRFALREALKIWPGSSQARQILEQCTIQMIRMELAIGNILSAELLMEELETVPSELKMRLDELRALRNQSAADQERLRLMEHELDVRVGSSRRSWLMILLASIVIATASTYTLLTGEIIIKTHTGSFFTGLAIILVCAIITPFFHKVILQTTLNRRLMMVFYTGCVGVLLSRGLGFAVPTSVEAAFVMDMVLMGLSFAIAAICLEPRLLWAALSFVPGIVLSMLKPSLAYVSVCATTMLAAASAATIWLKIEKENAVEE